ncbi:MAG: hypothetical protein DPW09_19265 [Anaerolineae bacterium]|nr:hypothetical protein [Anaerolineae bacterium]MCQ3975582.1 hypothetical protein [Anaerolineae bacterium]
MRNEPLDPPELYLMIDAPADGDVVAGPASGQPLVVTGIADGNRVKLNTLSVTVNRTPATVAVATGGAVTWTASLRPAAPGAFTIRAEGRATASAVGNQPLRATPVEAHITLSDAIPPHDVAVLNPGAGELIFIQEGGSDVPVTVRAVDHLGVAQVECTVDNSAGATPLNRDPADPALWRGSVRVSSTPLGSRLLNVRATDLAGNSTVVSNSFVAVDQTPPAYQIVTPAEGEKLLSAGVGIPVRLTGTARDLQSGVALVEWSADGLNFSQAQTGDNWANWQATVPVPDFGFYEVLVRFSDTAGNRTTAARTFEVISSYKPKDTAELLSPRAYLDSLLAFVRDHVRDAAGAAVATDDLEALYFQPFGKLKEPLSEVGNLPVNRLRVPLEVLRKYLTTNPVYLAAHWRCAESGGGVLGDASNLGHKGTLVNGASFLGVGGRQAVSFNGAQARVEVPNNLSLEVGKADADFAVTFWLYLRQGATGDWRAIMHKGNRNEQRTFALWMFPHDNRLHYRISTDVEWNEGGDSQAQIALNTWVHLAYVKSGRQLNLYLDGALDSSVTLQGASMSNDGPLYLGADPWYLGIDGALTDVRIYQMALNEATIQTLIESAPQARPEPSQDDYLLVAYTSLLRSLGTSYEEIRLAPGAPAAERKALAARLGISLGASRPDALDQLLAPAPLTESWLEQVFGLPDTRRNLAAPPAAQPALLGWQLIHLKEQWQAQDHPGPASGVTRRPIIDPDLIGESDLRNPVAGNLAFDLWQARQSWVEGVYADLRAKREGEASPVAGFDRVIADTLGAGVNLAALEADYHTGREIRPALAALKLSLEAFLQLVRLRALAQAGAVSSQEWAGLYSILTQVRKLQEAQSWLAQEQALTLSPEHFQLAAASTPLPAWRATAQERRVWQDLLWARIAQQSTLEAGLKAAGHAAEQAAMPVLRDALLVAMAGLDAVSQAGDKLVDRLFLDVKDSGSQQTTRILQAVETLQQVVFALRTLTLDPNHPASKWQIVDEGASLAEQEQNFDQEWQWLASYESWRAINYVFLYPENYLLPSLRQPPTASDAYKTWLEELRKTPLLTPKQARQSAEKYLNQVKATLSSLPADFKLTDQLSKQDLQRRGELDQELWAAAGYEQIVAEVFYFVPLQLALQLQKSGHYVAALDWYQTIYAYNLPVQIRKVSYILRREQNAAPQITRDAHWLRKATNPHIIAMTRPNPYTRFVLMSLGQCLVEYADAQYAAESLGSARALYLTARALLHLPELDLIQPTGVGQALLPNPVLDGLRQRVETQLAKLRQGRNFAGMIRQVDLPTPRTVGGLPPAAVPSAPQRRPRPTPYRFNVLMERSKQLVNIAQQIESAYLNALREIPTEEYNQRKATQDLGLAQAQVGLHDLRVTEAKNSEGLATNQRLRAEIQGRHYQHLLNMPVSQKEQESLDALEAAWDWTIGSAVVQSAGAIAGGVAGAIAGYNYGGPAGSTVGGFGGALAGALVQGLPGIGQAMQSVASSWSIHSQALSMQAGWERRAQEWQLQKDLAGADAMIGAQSELIARNHTAIVRQEYAIAQLQVDHAQAMVDFLANKFLNAELYEWMSGVLGGVYRFFLQQATAMAKLAEMQLTFERQVSPRAFIQVDYWEAPTEGDPATGSQASPTDRRGLTGSARLLQDIYQLDQYAFEVDKRKLNLTQTFSLAQLAPFEFQRFRQTGVLPFATPITLFDRAFPGHYLRLIKRVRTTVVALVPPNQGIRATLVASGISRVATGGPPFEEVVIRREPELVALTSPINATGVFELDLQSEMLFPFESMGVDTTWELQMPRAANPFDFNTIADVLLTIEYTALYSPDFKLQIIQQMDPSIIAERTISLRDQFPDIWYQLHNPDDPEAPLTILFETARTDFPPNLQEIAIHHLLMHFVRREDRDAAFPWDEANLQTDLSFAFTAPDGRKLTLGGAAQPNDRTISTRRGNGVSWQSLIGQPPIGQWTLTLPAEANAYFQAGLIGDILLMITYSGQLPEWPV